VADAPQTGDLGRSENNLAVLPHGGALTVSMPLQQAGIAGRMRVGSRIFPMDCRDDGLNYTKQCVDHSILPRTIHRKRRGGILEGWAKRPRLLFSGGPFFLLSFLVFGALALTEKTGGATEGPAHSSFPKWDDEVVFFSIRIFQTGSGPRKMHHLAARPKSRLQEAVGHVPRHTPASPTVLFFL